tara:strand:- start:483 stop:662 length:180 start_codon:yes stop_codon:yes gene_type:complete
LTFSNPLHSDALSLGQSLLDGSILQLPQAVGKYIAGIERTPGLLEYLGPQQAGNVVCSV